MLDKLKKKEEKKKEKLEGCLGGAHVGKNTQTFPLA